MSMDPQEAVDMQTFAEAEFDSNGPLICIQEVLDEVHGKEVFSHEENNDCFEFDNLMDILLDSEQRTVTEEGLSEDSMSLRTTRAAIWWHFGGILV